VTHASPGSWIDVADIKWLRPEVLAGPKNPNPEALFEDDGITCRDAIRAFRRKLIGDRLQRHGGNVCAAAASLGISNPTFHRHRSEGKRLL
jgi:DNA-binding NtrC family response regulator